MVLVKYLTNLKVVLANVVGEYLANSCRFQGPGCEPCESRLVSCAGRPDGNNSYPGHVSTSSSSGGRVHCVPVLGTDS